MRCGEQEVVLWKTVVHLERGDDERSAEHGDSLVHANEPEDDGCHPRHQYYKSEPASPVVGIWLITSSKRKSMIIRCCMDKGGRGGERERE